MAKAGTLSHIDISVGYPERSIQFFDPFFTTLGYTRWYPDNADWQEPNPSRAAWGIMFADGSTFGVEVRPARPDSRDRKYDRYEPGPHHIAFNAESRQQVDDVHEAVKNAGGEVLDPPTDYSGQEGYADGYYAVFFADPDNIKLEVVYLPEE